MEVEFFRVLLPHREILDKRNKKEKAFSFFLLKIK